MKVRSTPPLLCLHISDLQDLEDLTVILEAPERGQHAAQLIVRASGRSWNAPMYCGTQDPVAYLATMSPTKLRDALDYSRPAGRNEGVVVQHMTYEIALVIPRAVQIHLASMQPAPAGGAA